MTDTLAYIQPVLENVSTHFQCSTASHIALPPGGAPRGDIFPRGQLAWQNCRPKQFMTIRPWPIEAAFRLTSLRHHTQLIIGRERSEMYVMRRPASVSYITIAS
jgi:hypothetical protein